jgi:hypothetical protein
MCAYFCHLHNTLSSQIFKSELKNARFCSCRLRLGFLSKYSVFNAGWAYTRYVIIQQFVIAQSRIETQQKMFWLVICVEAIRWGGSGFCGALILHSLKGPHLKKNKIKQNITNIKLGTKVNIYLGLLPGPWKGPWSWSFTIFTVNLPLAVQIWNFVWNDSERTSYIGYSKLKTKNQCVATTLLLWRLWWPLFHCFKF